MISLKPRLVWISSAKPLHRPGMHTSIRYVLSVAAALGTFPVSNITSPSPRALQFLWCRWVTLYSLCLLSGFLTIEVVAIKYSIKHLTRDDLTVAGGFKKATGPPIFYGTACTGASLFLYLAKDWPDLANKWRSVELSMKRFGQPKLFLRFITIATVFMSFAMLEHGIHDYLHVKSVNSQTNETVLVFEYVKSFALKSHWYLYEEHDYSTWKGCATVWLSLSGTFLWNFIDLFIMLVSSALSAQFQILIRALRLIRGKVLTQLQWREYREMYVSLTHLVKLVDFHINKIILLSVANNVYFICAQLELSVCHFKQETEKKDLESQLFYLYSLFFLVGRTTAMVVQAAAINDKSRLVAPELFLCPPQSYCTEVQRFLQEVTSDYIALTGLNMFPITRNFLLGIAGAILTYAIVIIQLQTAN